MNSFESDYKDPRWRAKRIAIIKRDSGACRRCGATELLQVHHTIYHKMRRAWEYDGYELVTLCQTCHKKTHEHLEIIKTSMALIESEIGNAASPWSMKEVSDIIMLLAHDTPTHGRSSAFKEIIRKAANNV